MGAITTSRRRATAGGTGAQKGRKITLNHIARRAGVSVAAVSLALAQRPGIGAATRDRIVRLSRELGYVPRHGALPSLRPVQQILQAPATSSRKRVALAMVCAESTLKLEIRWLQCV